MAGSLRLTNRDIEGSSNCDPGIIDRQSHSADTQDPILSVQLIAMTRGIDDLALGGVNDIIWRGGRLVFFHDAAHVARL